MAKLTFTGNSEKPPANSAGGSLFGNGRNTARVPGQSMTTSVPGMDGGRRATGTKATSNTTESLTSSADGAASGVPGADQQQAPSLFKDRSADPTGPNYGYSRIRFRKSDEINPYAEMEDARHALDPRMKSVIIMVVVLIIVFFLSATLPTQLLNPTVRSNNSLAAFLRDFSMQTQGLLTFFTGQESMYTAYVWEIVAGGLAGAALGLSGGVYQGAMKNALASPSTLGVTQGGALGLILYGLFFYRSYSGSIADYNAMLAQMSPIEYATEMFGGFFSSLIACFAVVGLTMLIAYIAGRGHVTNVSLIIAGQVFAAAIGVAISWIRYYLTEVAADPVMVTLVQTAQSASFGGAYTLSTVAVFAVPVLICMGLVFAMSPQLSLLAFNDEEARSMGISTRFTRNLMVALCTALTALVVSFVGMIGFVGFMVPHIARKVVGPDFRYLLPASALIGAILIVAVHYLASMGIPGFDTNATGLFTSIVGCVMFLVMALRTRGGKHADWF